MCTCNALITAIGFDFIKYCHTPEGKEEEKIKQRCGQIKRPKNLE